MELPLEMLAWAVLGTVNAPIQVLEPERKLSKQLESSQETFLLCELKRDVAGECAHGTTIASPQRRRFLP